MKKLLVLLFAMVAILTVQAQSAIFTDSFNNGSTTNAASIPGGTANASSTSYDLASSKDGRTCSIGSGKFTVKLASGTTAGYVEAQAIFASAPVQLVNIGDSISLTVSFTNTSGTLLVGGNGSVICAGLFYSGNPSVLPLGVSPWLVNAGLGSGTTFTNGYCQNWQGYVAQLASNTLTSKVYTRTNQGAVNNANQDLLFSGAGTGLYNAPGGTQLGANFTAGPTLVPGAKYTMSLTILLSAIGQVAVTNSLFDASGNLICTYGGMSSGGASFINNGNYFDGLAIGIANKGASFNPLMDISQITVTKNAYAAPVITGLTNRTVVAGTSPALSPTVTGNPIPAYQWQTNGVNIGAATSASLTLTDVQFAQDGWVYALIATNVMGAVTNSMTLSVIVTPSITGLNNQSGNVGDNISISPTVGGVPVPSCQWRRNGVNLTDGLDGNGSTLSGSTTTGLSIANAQAADSGTYSLVASNSAGIVTNSMTLTVASGNQAPVITGPTNITVIQGNAATFIASATGVPVPTLQWLDQTGTPITDATNGTLVLNNVQYSQNGYVYSIVASNTAGVVTNSATLAVYVPPSISVQPANLVVTNTQSATFSVTAIGVPTLAYQWYFSNNPVSGATSSNYNIAGAAATNIGNYYVIITNAAGAVTSSVASLVVNSTMSVLSLSPNNSATGICYDTPLAITFDTAPSLGAAGTIKIYSVTNSTTPADTINIALGAVQQRTFPGDGQSFSHQTIRTSGNTAKIYPHFNVLNSNQTYYVKIDNGAFTDSSGAYFTGITATNVWQFSTKVGGPIDPANPVVNADGSADFLTVQGAVNSIPAGTSATQRVINIHNGLYNEIVDIAGKHNVTLRGQSRAGVVIFYPNNATFQSANSGTTHARMSFKVNANDIVLDTLTVSNSTPQGGSQAEALMLETGAKRCIIFNCDINSRQDTILANVNSSQAYFYQSSIRGNFDYIWGGGNLFFDHCIMHTISGTGGGNLTAARTDTAVSTSANFPWANPGGTFTANGMSLVNCKLEADPGVNGITLAGNNGTVGGLVSWVFCSVDLNAYTQTAGTLSNSYVFWQYQDTDTNGNAATLTGPTVLPDNDPRLLAATNVTTWFYGWTPQLPPYIASQPGNQTVSHGQTATFTVSATGIPGLTYQWFKSGTNLPGATAATLNLPGAQRSDGGDYFVVASNGSGSVTSSVVTLTYNNTAPAAPDFTIGALLGTPATVLIVGGKYAPTDVDNDPLTLASVTGVTNGIVSTDGTSITYTATNGPSDAITYTVSDGFNGTANATVTVLINSNPQGYNLLSVVSLGNGTNVLTFAGIPTYNYALEMATNLMPPINWLPQATNPAANNGGLIFTNVSTEPQTYYRTRYVP